MPYSFRSSGRPASRRGSYAAPRFNKRQNKKDYIDPSKFIKSARRAEAQNFVALHTFADFAVHPVLNANLQAKGFAAPSPIQDQTIPLGLAGKDVLGVANTGPAKSIAFALPVL